MDIIMFGGETSRRAGDCMQDMQTSESRQTPTCAPLKSRLPAPRVHQLASEQLRKVCEAAENFVLLLSLRNLANNRSRALKGQVVFRRLVSQKTT